MVQNSPKAAAAPTPPAQHPTGLDRFFEITARGSSVGGEVRGGLVTFFTMAYIVALNPIIIGTSVDGAGNLITGVAKVSADGTVNGAAVGASMAAVAAATALIAGLMTIFMGVYGKFPIAMATGLGLNALVAYVIAPQMTWPKAMGLIFWEGVIITILVLTGFRKAVFNAVPPSLRTGISVGIGLFIAFIGLVDSGLVRKASGTPVELGVGGSLIGWPLFVAVVSLLLLIGLYVRKVKGSMLIAILGATILGIVIEAVANVGPMTDGDTTNPHGWALNVPALSGSIIQVPDLSLLFRVDPIGAFTGGAMPVIAVVLTIFALLLADFFDTMGTVVAVGSQAGLLDAKGNPPRIQQILLVDSIGAAVGGIGSVSSTTSYVESTAGVGEGARTGFASVITGLAFLVTVFLSPLVKLVPSEAAGPILFFVGFLMMTQVAEIDWTDMENAIPAFVTLALMPFTYSITNGIGAGFILYTFIKVLLGKARQVHPLMWVVAGLFVVYFAQGLILELV